jgi:hypothetical protein
MLQRRLALAASSLVFAAAIVLTFLGQHGTAAFSSSHPLVALAPAPPVGWAVSNTPLGPTELASGDAARTLHFDQYFFKTYTKGSTMVRIYVAYWGPGRIDPILVAAHTPDACWTTAGGVILNGTDSEMLPAPPHYRSRAASFRIFQFPGAREEVVFWYLLGGRPVHLANDLTGTVGGRLNLFYQMLNLTKLGITPRDQVFVRISTNRTIEEITKSNLWPPLVSALITSGIFEPSR